MAQHPRVGPGIGCRALLLGFVILGPGCGLGLLDGPGGGDQHLPTRGAGPYSKLPFDRDTLTDEPHVVSVFQIDLTEPTALPRSDGGFRLWFGYSDPPELHEIWTAELSSLTEFPEVGPMPALAPDQEWEAGRVGAPCVVEVSSQELVMFYEGGPEPGPGDSQAPGIGRATSLDGGATWVKDPANPVLTGYREPTAAHLPDGEWLLFATRDDAPGLFRAVSTDGISWQADDAAVVEPRPLPEAFDRHAVSSPALTVRSRPGGGLHFGLFFNGLDGEDGSASVGWAGSFDGMQWDRFSNPDGPVLAPGGTSERGPSVVLEPDQGIMFFSEQKQGSSSIAAAVHP